MTPQISLFTGGQSAWPLLEGLLKAQSEREVHDCLKGADLLEDANWRPYGGVENNGGSFLNQQASPRGALVEKIVNSIDAVLTAKAYEHRDLPDTPPATMFAAAQRYFGIRDGRLAEITPTERGQIARQSVQVVVSGKRSPGRPTVTITDQGEGQTPDSFPQTFLSLSASNKFRLPFVQGKFNMGSTGAVPFCGKEHNYQLIVSRRHFGAPGDSSRWGFTVVRRRRPTGDERLSQFQYLAPHGEVPTVSADALPIWGTGSGGFEEIESGSLVRLYEYDLEEKTNAVLDFSRMLNRLLYRLPLPIQIVEHRDFKGHSLENIIPGLETRLADDPAEVVEDGFPIKDSLVVEGLGEVGVSLVPFQEDAETGRWVRASESVIFTVNGQAHAFEPRDFFRRGGQSGVGFTYLAPSLLVEVDCSALSASVTEQLFMGSRDRMRDIDQKRALLAELATYLRQHEGLRALNATRRVNALKKSVKSDARTMELFREMARSSPAVTAILRGAGPIPSPMRVTTQSQVSFDGRRYPTYLRWLRGGPFLEKECPANSYCEVDLETDAENAFLSRPSDAGECFIEPPGWMKARKLWEGKLSIRLQPPPGMPAGHEVPLRVAFRSPEMETLEVEGRLRIAPEHVPGINPSGPTRPRQPGAVAPPTIREVRKDSWDVHGFDDRSVARVDVEEEETTVFVNMDNRGLEGYCYSEPRRADEFREMYKLSSAALAVSLKRAIDKEEIPQEEADKAFAAIGDVLVPAVDFAGKVRPAD